MKAPLIAIAIAIAVAHPAFASDATPTLTADGQGIEIAAPDIATVTLGVLSRAETARAALDANNSDMDRLISAIREEGIADRDIATSGFSIRPVYSQPPQLPRGETPAAPKIVAYQVSNQLRIVIRDLAVAGTVLDKAVSAGANQAASIKFDIDNREALVDGAMRSAIADARRKAALMAEAAGVRLVRILNVSASESGGGRQREAIALSAEAVPVMGGELAVAANASINWEIAPE